MKLPDDMMISANLDSPEEAWKPADFPQVLARASAHGLVCIGGQFQFCGPVGIAEMYWLNADSQPREPKEVWATYVNRANAEVLAAFNHLMAETDFDLEAGKWKHIVEALASGAISDPKQHLYFVAYFNEEKDNAEQSSAPLPRAPQTGHSEGGC